MRSVKGKRVLVTGGAMGMGRLFAERAIAEQAAAVVLWDVNEAALNDTLNELADSATEISGYIVDVADAEEVAGTAAAVLDDLKGIDVLINNAGVVRGNKYFWETDLEHDTKATIDINTLGPMYVAHEFLPAMIAESGECRMLNLASAAGFTPNPRMAVYAASKWAVIGWSDSVRLELKQAGLDHVKVTTVCPYYVRTGMFDGARSAEPPTRSGKRSARALSTLPDEAREASPLASGGKMGRVSAQPSGSWPARRRSSSAPPSKRNSRRASDSNR